MRIAKFETKEVPWINEEFLHPALLGPSRYREEGTMVLLSAIKIDEPVFPADIILYIAQNACRGGALGGANQLKLLLERCRPSMSTVQLQILFEVLHDGYEVIKERGEDRHRYALSYRQLMIYIAAKLKKAGEVVPHRAGLRRSIIRILSPQITLRG